MEQASVSDTLFQCSNKTANNDFNQNWWSHFAMQRLWYAACDIGKLLLPYKVYVQSCLPSKQSF